MGEQMRKYTSPLLAGSSQNIREMIKLCSLTLTHQSQGPLPGNGQGGKGREARSVTLIGILPNGNMTHGKRKFHPLPTEGSIHILTFFFSCLHYQNWCVLLKKYLLIEVNCGVDDLQRDRPVFRVRTEFCF